MDQFIWVSAGAPSGGDGSAERPYSLIQDAIDAAVPGTVIMVGAGLYEENLEFSTSGTSTAPIALVSADGPNAAIIKPAKANEDTIQIDGTDNIIVQGFELHGSDDASRQVIHIHAVDDNTDPASNIIIADNTIYRGAGDGIKGSKSTDLTITNNTIIGGGDKEAGIDLVGVTRATVSDNTLLEMGNIGIMVKGGSSDIAITGNTIDNPDSRAMEIGGYTNLNSYPPGFLESGLEYEVNNVLVSGNTITADNSTAMRLIGAQNVEITDNKIDGAFAEIKIDDSSKFHEPWFSTSIVFSENDIDNPDWLIDRSAKAEIQYGSDADGVFAPWLEPATGSSAPLPEPEVVEVQPEPQPEPEVVEVQPEPQPEPEPEVVEVQPEPQPEPEPEVAEVQPEPAPELALDGLTRIEGTGDKDYLVGSGDDEAIWGFDSDDVLKGRNGDDFLDGGDGNDRLLGGSGHDTVFGGDGKDLLRGDNGDDLLFGMDGHDTLRGGSGDDTLEGGAGNDVMEGGRGNDSFTFRADIGFDRDRINDFDRGDDVIVFSGFDEDLLSFDDLDTNGNGRLDRNDDLVSVGRGSTKIDLSSLWGADNGTHLIEIDQTGLTADDFSFLV